MEVWLQRISHAYEPRLAYKEILCQLVQDKAVSVWNDAWISSTKLKTALDPGQIVDRRKLTSLKPVIRPLEVEVFSHERY